MHSLTASRVGESTTSVFCDTAKGWTTSVDPPELKIPASLFMIGVSMPNRIGSGYGPRLRYQDAEGLRSVKLPAEEVSLRLHELCSDGFCREAWIWNTCNRFEIYGWTAPPSSTYTHDTIAAEIMRRVFGKRTPSKTSLNILRDTHAVHHVLRTTAGLNSELLGEKDIAQQLQGALRLARSTGTAGPLTGYLISRAGHVERRLRQSTSWHKYAPSYCSALLDRLGRFLDSSWQELQFAVIGRSVTSFSVLKLLTQELGVPGQAVTFIHRGNRRVGQIKQMRRLMRNGRKLRVDTYADEKVIKAVAASDVSFYGIDHPLPVLDGQALSPLLARDPQTRAVIDFNTFGSTTGVDELPGIMLWDATRIQAEVNHFADEMCDSDIFWQTVNSVERQLADHASAVSAKYHFPLWSPRPQTNDSFNVEPSCLEVRS